MMTNRTRITAAFVALLCSPTILLADGGTLRASQRLGDYRASVFTSPAVLRVGTIDLSMLLQNAATSVVLSEPEIRIRLERLDGPAIPLEQTATVAAATNKLFRAAQFEIPQAGTWRAIVIVGDEQPMNLELSIEPPLPAWRELAPWVGWPFGVAALFVLHRILVARAAIRGERTGTVKPSRTTIPSLPGLPTAKA